MEDIYLGPFRIQLELNRFDRLYYSSPYSVIALDPNPAAGNDSVTHPHVNDEKLCEGDGCAAIRAALEEGRIVDFFTLVRSILNTYSPDNEVGGFAVTDADDLLFVREFVTVKQEVTCVSVKFDDAAVADFFDAQVDLGRKPEQFARTWLHSHPGNSPEPSAVDEETFERVFGNCQWAVLFVVAQDNKTYARLRFNVGPGGQVLIPTEIDYGQDFGSSSHELWDAEYTANVKAIEWPSGRTGQAAEHEFSSCGAPDDFLDEFERMDLVQRQLILDELADRPDLWDQEGAMAL